MVVVAGCAELCLASVAIADDANGFPDSSLANSLPPSLATFGGLRPALAARGVTFQLNETAEAFSNLTGGLRRGTAVDNQLELTIDVNLEQLAGWKGGAIHVNGFQIDGSGISRDYVGNLLTVSNIEALPSTRLYEAWFEQKFAGDKLAIRVGQLGADGQFINSDYAGIFINGTFGWPGLTSVDLPSGGPAYPLATPGIRVKYDYDEKVSYLAGLFDGDPAGPGPGDPQQRDPNGVNFRVSDPPFFINELQLKYGDKAAPLLPGTLKLGAWEHFGEFADQRFDTNHVSLASPASDGVALQHRDDWGVYGVVDQQLNKPVGTGPALGAFARVLASPSDRNLLDFYVDAGLNVAHPFGSRPDDTFGVAVAYAGISPQASALDRDGAFYAGRPLPIRDYESVVEATYSVQIKPGWTVQPDVQYVAHPGGHVPDPADPTGARALGNALVLGVRTSIQY